MRRELGAGLALGGILGTVGFLRIGDLVGVLDDLRSALAAGRVNGRHLAGGRRAVGDVVRIAPAAAPAPAGLRSGGVVRTVCRHARRRHRLDHLFLGGAGPPPRHAALSPPDGGPTDLTYDCREPYRWPAVASQTVLRSARALQRGPTQNVTRMPPLITRPSSGAHASTVHRPSARRAGSTRGSSRVCRTSSRFSLLRKSPIASELAFRERTEQDVGTAGRPVGILLQRLAAGVVAFHAQSTSVFEFPHHRERRALAGRQRHIAAIAAVRLDLRRARPAVRDPGGEHRPRGSETAAPSRSFASDRRR